MARYFKRSYRKRKGYYRRTRTKPRYRKYYRRRYTRSRRSKVEYKIVQQSFASDNRFTYSNAINDTNNNYIGLYGPFIRVYALHNIPQGTGVSQRIGAKINPVKLRIFGSLSFISLGAQDMIIPSAIMVRFVCFQIRNGNPEHAINDPNYSSINPIYNADSAIGQPATGTRLFTEYHGRNGLVTVDNQIYSVTYVRNAELAMYAQTARVPFRRGIGGSVKILKDKVYTLQTGHKTTFPFRFKVKKPNRMVWPESADGEQAINLYTRCKNPVFFTWWLVPTDDRNYSVNLEGQPLLDFGSVLLNFSYELTYTDS